MQRAGVGVLYECYIWSQRFHWSPAPCARQLLIHVGHAMIALKWSVTICLWNNRESLSNVCNRLCVGLLFCSDCVRRTCWCIDDCVLPSCCSSTVIPMAICWWNVKCNCYWSVFRLRDFEGFLLLLGWEDYFGMTCENCSPDLHYRIEMKQSVGAVAGCF